MEEYALLANAQPSKLFLNILIVMGLVVNIIQIANLSIATLIIILMSVPTVLVHKVL